MLECFRVALQTKQPELFLTSMSKAFQSLLQTGLVFIQLVSSPQLTTSGFAVVISWQLDSKDLVELDWLCYNTCTLASLELSRARQKR